MRHAAAYVLTDDADRHRLERSDQQYAASGLTDYFFGDSVRRCEPDRVFDHLRWGGQVVFVSCRPRALDHLLQRYRQSDEFHIDTEPQSFDRPLFERTPRWRRKYMCFVARKVLLDRAREPTDRHSYHVCLAPGEHGYVVVKQVPSFDQAYRRLTRLMPGVDSERIGKSALKLVRKVFPIFLTREAAFLRLLEHHLPEPHRARVPRVLKLIKDDRGLIRRIEMNWLRLGAPTMPLVDFARQSAELLHALHESVGIIHLDLRLDNFVVTENGVGFVDFGSSARVGEDLSENQLLHKLFNEMLSSSQIHHDLKRLQERGRVTSSLFRNCYQRIDKAIDLFYLAVQLTYPDNNTEFRGLVDCARSGEHFKRLQQLRQDVLRPADPDNPPYKTVSDVHRAIMDIQHA